MRPRKPKKPLTPGELRFLNSNTGWHRCHRCQPPLEFHSKERRCPKCGAGGEALVDLVFVHLLYEDRSGHIQGQYESRWRLACMPELRVLDGESASDMPFVVTCPACKASPKWFEACEKYGVEKQVRSALLIRMNDCCGG